METSHQTNDHDLLVRIDEQIKGIKVDMVDLKSGFGERIAVIEENKMDKTESTRLLLESDKIHDDHEKRLRTVEDLTAITATQLKTYGSVAVVLLALLQIVLKVLVK